VRWESQRPPKDEHAIVKITTSSIDKHALHACLQTGSEFAVSSVTPLGEIKLNWPYRNK
jgi:hypothetical protein